jgi:hypothetical protein
MRSCNRASESVMASTDRAPAWKMAVALSVTLGAPFDGDAHDHVVEDVDVIVPDPLDGLREVQYRRRPFSIGHARKLDCQLHEAPFRTIVSPSWLG